MWKHKEANTPEDFRQALQKISGKTDLSYFLKPVIKYGKIIGTAGHILNNDNGNCVYVDSNQYSPYMLQIEYRYVQDITDTEGGGLNRRGEKPEAIAREIIRMLCETDKTRVNRELKFKKYRRQYA